MESRFVETGATDAAGVASSIGSPLGSAAGSSPVVNPANRVPRGAGTVAPSIGHVTVNERVPSQRFNRFVEEKVRDWMQDHDLDPLESDYEVAFFDEEALGEVSCLVVIQSGPQLWRAWESSDNSRLALSHSLETLKVEDHGDERAASTTQLN